MNKLFEDIRSLANKEIETLRLSISESLDKLYEQVKSADRVEEKLPQKRAKTDTEPQKKPRIEELPPRKEEKKAESPKEKSAKLEKAEKIEKEEKAKTEEKAKKEEIPAKHEDSPAKVEEPKAKAVDKARAREPSPSSSKSAENIDLDSVGLGSSSDEKTESEEEEEEKEVPISELPKTKENIASVSKMLDDPCDKLEEIADFFQAIIDSGDPDLIGRIKRIDFDKKLSKQNMGGISKEKLKKIWRFVKESNAQNSDPVKELENLKKRLEAAISKKNDQEIIGTFRRFDDKIKDNLSDKEVPVLQEVLNSLSNLIKTYKNGEIRKAGSSLHEKLKSKLDSLTRKKHSKY